MSESSFDPAREPEQIGSIFDRLFAGAVHLRDGDVVLPAEYPAKAWAEVGERLDAIAAEGDEVLAVAS